MPEIIQTATWQQWLILAIVAIAIGMSKAGLGFGLMVVPLLAFGFGARESTGVMIPMLITADIFAVAYYHRMAEWKHIIRLLPWATLGILAGAATGKMVSAAQFRAILSAIVVIGLIIMILRDLRRKTETIPTHPGFAIILGILGGFSSMVGNAAGPIFAIYLLAMRLPKNTYIGTGAWFYLIVNVIKLPFHIWAWKTITPDSLMLNFIAIPVILGGAWAGIRMVKWFNEHSYRLFIMVMTLLSALFLFFR